MLPAASFGIPDPTPNRRGQVLQGSRSAHYFVVGLLVTRALVGLSKGCRSRVAVMQFLNKWLLRLFPGQTWASIAVSHNQLTNLHTDAGNEPGP